MKKECSEEIKTFQVKMLSWYEKNQRDLPWRKTSDPYAILVSEVMSQQTQISRVIPKYLLWMETFPTVDSLAYASTAQILTHWSGLGYNRRALHLQKAAMVLVQDYKGQWPTNPLEIEKLPGVGKYTASAVACFAFNAQIPVIDTNVRKVIAIEFNEGILPSEKDLQEVAWKILPVGKAKDWNQALMDYAGQVLKKEKIPVPRQSKFIGSNRWYRGDVVRLLTKQQSVTLSELARKWGKDSEKQDREWFEILLSSLEKEGFIIRKDEQIWMK